MLDIPMEEVADSLATENPWWTEGRIDRRYRDMPRRGYFNLFFPLVTETDVRRAVILMGPRRVGKTVMIQQAIQALIEQGAPPRAILYVSIDAPTYTGLGLEKLLKLFLQNNGIKRDDPAYIFFDEVQYLENWEAHLKSLVDRYPSLQFVASGSAAAALKRASTESGAGRFTDFLLPPLTFAEYLHFIGRDMELLGDVPVNLDLRDYSTIDIASINEEFVNYINFGGYPEAVMSGAARENPTRYIKSDIIDKVLLRDLPSLYGISNIQELNRLFTMTAHGTGHEISLDNLSSASGVSKPTIQNYLKYLEAAFLIRRVRRVDENGVTFQRERNFKVYLTNPSMRAALFNPTPADGPAMGALAETAVVSQWTHDTDTPSLHYARWKRAGRIPTEDEKFGEVDLVFLRNDAPPPAWAVEIKWTDAYADNPRRLTGLIEAA